jgi:hypothetical protein
LNRLFLQCLPIADIADVEPYSSLYVSDLGSADGLGFNLLSGWQPIERRLIVVGLVPVSGDGRAVGSVINHDLLVVPIDASRHSLTLPPAVRGGRLSLTEIPFKMDVFSSVREE